MFINDLQGLLGIWKNKGDLEIIAVSAMLKIL